MAENLSLYTEVDPNSHISKTSSRVTLAGLTETESAYVYKNFGAAYFNKIDLIFSGRISTGATGQFDVGFSNELADASGWWGFDYKEIRIVFQLGYIYLYCGTNSDYYAISWDTDYYLTLSRSAGSDSATLKIYSDAARSNLLATLTASGLGTGTKYQYFYAASSYNVSHSGHTISGYVENFLFPMPIGSGGAQIIGLSDI